MEIYHIPEREPLNAVELKNPFAPLYDLPIHDPAPEILEHLLPGKPMNSANALPVTEFEKLFIPGALKQYNGYCLAPDGTGFSAVTVKMNLTPEMERFWECSHWISQDDVHYKVWFPGMHFSHKMPVTEDLGWGVGHVNFAVPLDLSQLLSRPPEELDPNFLGFSGCAAFFYPLDNPDDIWYSTIANCVRATFDGLVEVTTLCWSGVHYIDGKAIRKIPLDMKADLERTRLFACHNAWENTRKGEVFPRVYKMMHVC